MPDDEASLFGLTSTQVAQAIRNLDPALPKGEVRYVALRSELMRLFGDCTGFTAHGLTELELWTGHQVRGEPALSL